MIKRTWFISCTVTDISDKSVSYSFGTITKKSIMPNPDKAYTDALKQVKRQSKSCFDVVVNRFNRI